MPIFSALFLSLAGKAFALLALVQAQHWGVRIAVVTSLATVYVACVVVFTAVIGPLFNAVTSSNYGQLIGLLFPPMAGTVLGLLAGLWGAILANRLTVRLLKAV
jgi:hypothetical protein